LFPEWEFAVQIFPDDGTYMWKGIDLLDPTKIIPAEMKLVSSYSVAVIHPANFYLVQ
jgi:catalase